ncbi:MAG: hypothetical protein U1F26_14800 [Lysobacterales bacterium]
MVQWFIDEGRRSIDEPAEFINEGRRFIDESAAFIVGRAQVQR